MSTSKKGLFITDDGKNVTFTFIIVSSLFLLWGFCNGMIDVMDKHFQKELHLSLSESAWVQFAHWMGYFLMSLPAGWLAAKLGYKGGIIAGLLLVCVGGLWFMEASHIVRLGLSPMVKFSAFLLGVCVIASGLTFLETVANPYTTVLGPKEYAATRINLAQSCNGVGWVFGPIAGAAFFYGQDASGQDTGSQTIWIPYAGVAVVVLLLAIVFFFSNVPDIKTEDAYHLDDKNGDSNVPAPAARKVNRGLSYVLLLGNVAALLGVFGMILWLILASLHVGERLVGFASALPHPGNRTMTAESALLTALVAGGCVAFLIAAIWLAGVAKRLSQHSIWSHEHFSGATLAQFLYVAAQCGIFSFLINYVTSEPPSLPASWLNESNRKWIEVRTAFAGSDFKNVQSLTAKLTAKADPVSAFLSTNLSPETVQTLNRYKDGAVSDTAVRVAIVKDLNSLIIKQSVYDAEQLKAMTPEEKGKHDKAKSIVVDAQVFTGVTLQEKTKQLLAQDPEKRDNKRLNRLLFTDAYPNELAFQDGIVCPTDKLASNLASAAFICFLLGRVSGAALLRRVSAHRLVGLYSLLNVFVCLLVFLKLGWLSVVCVFLSYFFMSIMFPTIFALGIFGLGVRAKRASAYIVMGIVGGALLPKLMGAVADNYDMSKGFIVPMVCFIVIAFYGYCWPLLSGAPSLRGVAPGGGHGAPVEGAQTASR